MDRKVNAFWAFLTILLVMSTLALCVFGTTNGVLFARPTGNPQDAVTGFFNALKAGDYASACRYVDGYSSLGLENTPESEEGQLLFSALKKSYDYSLSGSCALAGTNASQKVLVRYLELDAVDAAAQSMPELEYIIALRQILADPEPYCTSDFFDIPVTYSNGKWLMTLDSSLLSALQGGHS